MSKKAQYEFCKIVLHRGFQILLTKDFDEDSESPYQLSQTIDDGQGLRTKLSFGFSKEEWRDESFDDYSETHADVFIGTIDALKVPTN